MPTDDANVTTPLGLLGLLGGVLFPVLLVGLGAVAPGGGSYANQLSFSGATSIPVVFWLAGAVAVYYRHRDAFGWLGRVGAATFLVFAAVNAVTGIWFLVSQTYLVEGVAAGVVFTGMVVGALLLGATVVRARELPHAVAGGLLLALGFPVSLALFFALSAVVDLGSVPLLATAVYTVPFGAGWVLVCYDVVVEPGHQGSDRVSPAD